MKSSASILLNTIPVVAWASLVLLAPGVLFAAAETAAGETDSRVSETRHFLGKRRCARCVARRVSANR